METKEEKIIKATGYTIKEILQMGKKDFVLKIARLQGTRITPIQYRNLEKMRVIHKGRGSEDALAIFGGEVIS